MVEDHAGGQFLAGGAADAARDAAHSDGDDYTVLAAALTVAKTSRVVSRAVDPQARGKALGGLAQLRIMRV